MAPCPTYRTPKLLLSGLDSLYVSCYLDVSGSDLDFDELAYLKERVQASRIDDFEEVELGSETFALKPYGKYPYRYILANDLFEIRLAEQLQPSCYVQLYSQGLWLFGLDALWGRFADWCSSLNLIATKPEVVSRADWAFDYHLACVDFEPDHFVSKADKRAVWSEHSKMQTIAFGKGDTVIRVYDKVAEIAQQSGKAYFFELWEQSEDVWRIEFQARRGRLKQGGIKTIETLKGRTACEGSTIRMDRLDELVLDHFERHVLEPSRLSDLLSDLMKRSKRNAASRRARLIALRRERRDLEKQLNRLYEAISQEKLELDDILRGQISSLKNRYQEVIRLAGEEDRRAQSPELKISPQAIARFAKVMRERLRDPNRKARKAYLRLFIDRIELGADEVRIRGSKAVLAHAAASDAPIWYRVPSFDREWWAHKDSNLGPAD